jgi:hypothetical protein
VEHEVPPFWRSCNDFHKESTFPRFLQINEARIAEENNYMGFSNHINCVGFSDRINCLGRTHPVSMGHWMQIKEKSEDENNVVKEYDNVTKLYG